MSTLLAAHSHSELSPAEVSRYYAVRHPDMVQRGSEWRSWCIRHKGKDPNFSVNAETGLWCCHSQCNCGGSVYDLEMALTNADFKTAAREVRRIVGRPEDSDPSEREPEMKWGLPGWSHEFLKERIQEVERRNKWRHTAVYPYFDAENRFSYVKVRFLDKQNDKTFRQFGVTKNLGWATRNKAGAKPILYHLNTLAAADEIFIVNGEKAADRGAAELGIATTCTPDGEGKWLGDYTRPLIGKAVRIIIDNDEKGATHGAVVSAAIVKHVREVRGSVCRACPQRAIFGIGSRAAAPESGSTKWLPKLLSKWRLRIALLLATNLRARASPDRKRVRSGRPTRTTQRHRRSI